MEFSPDGQRLAIGGQNGGDVILYNVVTGRRTGVLEGQPGDDVVFSVAYSPDGGLLASASQDIETSATSPDGAGLKGQCGDRNPLGHDARPKPTVIRRVGKIWGTVWAVAFSPDGKTLAAAADRVKDKVVRLWDVATGHERAPLRGHTDIIHSLAYSPDGTTLATASMDKTVKLWDATSGKELATLKGHTSAVKCVAFSPNSKMLATGSWDSTAKVWDVSGVAGRVSPVATQSPYRSRIGFSKFVTFDLYLNGTY